MKHLLILPLLLLLAACAMTEAQRAYLERNIERDVAAGNMTEDQAKELLEGGFDWGYAMSLLGTFVGSVFLARRMAVAQVNAERGPAKPMELTAEQVARLQRMAKEAT